MVNRDLKIRGVVVGQFPSLPLWVALVALLMAVLAENNTTLDDIAAAVFYVAITIWAWEEAAHGVNRFRRGLGIVALILILVSLAQTVS